MKDAKFHEKYSTYNRFDENLKSAPGEPTVKKHDLKFSASNLTKISRNF